MVPERLRAPPGLDVRSVRQQKTTIRIRFRAAASLPKPPFLDLGSHRAAPFLDLGSHKAQSSGVREAKLKLPLAISFGANGSPRGTSVASHQAHTDPFGLAPAAQRAHTLCSSPRYAARSRAGE